MKRWRGNHHNKGGGCSVTTIPRANDLFFFFNFDSIVHVFIGSFSANDSTFSEIVIIRTIIPEKLWTTLILLRKTCKFNCYTTNRTIFISCAMCVFFCRN